MTAYATLTVVLLFLCCAALSAQPAVDGAGDLLPDGAVARFGCGKLLHGNTRSAEFAPDGKTLATCGGQGARLWDLATGKDVSPPHLPRTGDVLLTFTPAGEHVLADGRGCRIIDPATGKVRCWWRRPDRHPVAVAVSADGKTAATVWNGGGVSIHDLSGPGPRPGRTLCDDSPDLLALAADGRLLALAESRGQAVRLWDTRAGKLLHTYTPAAESTSLHAVALSPDGQRLAVAWATSIDLWDTTKHTPIHRGDPNSAPCVVSLRFSPDGAHLDGASAYQAYYRWDAATGKQLVHSSPPRGYSEAYWRATISPDGRTYAGVASANVRLFDTKTWADRLPLDRWPGWSDLVFLDPTTFATLRHAESETLIAVWNLTDGKLLRQHKVGPLPAQDYYSPVLSPDGKHLAASLGEHGVLLFDVATGKRLRTLKPGDRGDPGQEYAFSPDGQTLATTDGQRKISLWDVATGRRLARLDGDVFGRLAFSPDGRLVASGSVSPFYLTEIATGKPRFQVRLPALTERAENTRSGYSINRIRFSGDGRTLAAFAAYDIHVLSTDRGRVLLHLADETTESIGEGAGCLSPDGRWLVHASDPSGALAVHDLHWPYAAVECQTLAGHASYVYGAEFSPDGKRLVTCSEDGTVLVWDVTKFTGRRAPPAADPLEGTGGEPQLPNGWLDEHWDQLGDPDPAPAARALATLAETPHATAAFLAQKLKPAPKTSAARIQRLVADLDAPEFAARQAAIEELRKIADQAAPALRQALAGQPSAEMKQNARHLLTAVDPPITDPNRLRQLRAVELLERLHTPAAHTLLERLACGAPAARLTQDAKAALGRWR